MKRDNQWEKATESCLYKAYNPTQLVLLVLLNYMHERLYIHRRGRLYIISVRMKKKKARVHRRPKMQAYLVKFEDPYKRVESSVKSEEC